MNRIFLTLALVFGLVATAAAQVNVGGRLAATMSTLKGDKTEDFSMGLGFNAAVAAKYTFNQMFAAAPELGIDFRRVTNSEADDFTFSAWVLQIPLMFRANVTPQFYAEAGPSIGFILSSEADYDEPEIAEDQKAAAQEFLGNTINEFDMYKNTNTFEFGIAAGLGYTVIPNLDVNFRFIMAFTNLFEDVDMGPIIGKQEIDVQHMQFSLGATYWFL